MNSDQILLEEFINNHTTDAARLIEQLKNEQISAFISKLPIELAVKLLKEMEDYSALRCIEILEIDLSAKIIERLPSVTTSSILRRMNAESRQKILEKIEPRISASLTEMLNHLDNTAGALMNAQISIIRDDQNVKEALDKIKKTKELLSSYVYVTDGDQKLRGVVKIEELIAAEPKELTANIMDTEIPRLFAEVEIQKILNHPGWADYHTLPVTDRSGVFLGALEQGMIRKVDTDKKRKMPRHAILASNALGELYRIGLSGIIYSTAEREIDSE